jgi:hypothetical protein
MKRALLMLIGLTLLAISWLGWQYGGPLLLQIGGFC